MAKHPTDAHPWPELSGLLRAQGIGIEREGIARRAVALVRRERATTSARTFSPGDEIPYDVAKMCDLDGDEWERQGQPPDSIKDTWKMRGFNQDEHESAAGGMCVTPSLLAEYGPLTEIRKRGKTVP
jgi:hypothetical protein